MKNDGFLTMPGAYADYFMPVQVSAELPVSMVVAAEEPKLCGEDFPLFAEGTDCYGEDGRLEEEIQKRKAQSSQLYANYYRRLSENSAGRGNFRKLYFLHPDIVARLQKIPPTLELLRQLPKAELHTHLGGVLSTRQLIEVALAQPERVPALPEWRAAISRRDMAALQNFKAELLARKKTDFSDFHADLLAFIAAFADAPEVLDELIFGEYRDPMRFRKVGIDAYQQLGDFQGSSLLQTRETIAAAVRLYAESLIADRVRYVELRISPYKYTRLGLSESEVVDCMMAALEVFRDELDYRFILIIGRQADTADLLISVGKALALMQQNACFEENLAGIDLAGAEHVRSPAEMRTLFLPFLEKCLHITIHAGEGEDAQNIWEAVYHLSADRIGHGLTLRNHLDLLPRFVDKTIGIELCPSSNDQIVGFEPGEYPLKPYMEAGIAVSINTDDCGISRTSLSEEFMKAFVLCGGGISLWDCLILIRNSLVTAFIDAKSKKKLLQRFEEEIHMWCIRETF